MLCRSAISFTKFYKTLCMKLQKCFFWFFQIYILIFRKFPSQCISVLERHLLKPRIERKLHNIKLKDYIPQFDDETKDYIPYYDVETKANQKQKVHVKKPSRAYIEIKIKCTTFSRKCLCEEAQTLYLIPITDTWGYSERTLQIFLTFKNKEIEILKGDS